MATKQSARLRDRASRSTHVSHGLHSAFFFCAAKWTKPAASSQEYARKNNHADVAAERVGCTARWRVERKNAQERCESPADADKSRKSYADVNSGFHFCLT